MRILAFDTSSSLTAVAVVDGERVLAEDDSPNSGRHGDVLLPRIERQLALAGHGLSALDLIAVGVGPGSFTGVRIGLATAKGLALATPLPLVGVCSLRVLARAIEPAAELLLPLLDAGKGEVFGALFVRRGVEIETLLAPTCAPPELLAAQLASVVPGACRCAGDGAAKYFDVFAAALGSGLSRSEATPNGRHVAAEARFRHAAVGPSDPETLAPTYLRGSDAKLPADALRLT